ncbi:MAG: hypothetical protein J6Q39_08970 [Bacteroidales bacterium]|nr:hypothetical protein [Bacteroidales bacterium]
MRDFLRHQVTKTPRHQVNKSVSEFRVQQPTANSQQPTANKKEMPLYQQHLSIVYS